MRTEGFASHLILVVHRRPTKKNINTTFQCDSFSIGMQIHYLFFWLEQKSRFTPKCVRSTNIKIYTCKMSRCTRGQRHTIKKDTKERKYQGKKKLFRNKSFNARVLITFCSSPLQHIDQNLLTRQHISLADGKSKRAKAREMVFGEFLHTKNCFHFYHKLMNQLWVKLSCCSRF